MIVATSPASTRFACSSYSRARDASAAIRARASATTSRIARTAGPAEVVTGSGWAGATTMTVVRAGNSGAMPRIFASCVSSETTTTLAPASSRMNWVCDADSVGYTGTLMAPPVRMARSAMDHSGRLSQIRPTRSPGPTPAPRSPMLKARTWSTYSPVENDSKPPATQRRSRTGRARCSARKNGSSASVSTGAVSGS